MVVTLLLSTALAARLLSATYPRFDLERLLVPKLWWMICLSALFQVITAIVDLAWYSYEIGHEQMLPMLGVLSFVPELYLDFIFGVIQTSTIIITNSVLTLFVREFDSLVLFDMTVRNFNIFCESFELIEEQLAPLYLLFFATASVTISTNAFLVYFYWGSVSTSINCATFVVNGVLVLFQFVMIAEDCHEAMRKLHLRLR